MIILKVTKNQGFTLCLEDTTFKKPQGGQIDPPPAVLGLSIGPTCLYKQKRPFAGVSTNEIAG